MREREPYEKPAIEVERAATSGERAIVSAHSPGPWRWGSHLGGCEWATLASCDGASVAWPVSSHEGHLVWMTVRSEVDARLIAAAPEMAGILRELLRGGAQDASGQCDCTKCRGTALLARIEGSAG
jgi:hypothetical protein